MIRWLVAAIGLGVIASQALAQLRATEDEVGSQVNISSLSAVVSQNPSDANGYNVRGTAYGKAGKYKEALADFDFALRQAQALLERDPRPALASDFLWRLLGNRARALEAVFDPGGDIMIHGLRQGVDHPATDWTQGCIAVTDSEMDEIWELVADGTAIEIYA